MEGLSVKQERTIEMLLVGSLHKEAAAAAGVAAETVSRWLREDGVFAGELERRRREMREARAARMEELEDAAMRTLRSLLEDGSATVRLRAVAVVMRRLRDIALVPVESEFEKARNEALDRLGAEWGIRL